MRRVNTEVFRFSDVLNILSTDRSLASLAEARLNRIATVGANAQDLRAASVAPIAATTGRGPPPIQQSLTAR